MTNYTETQLSLLWFLYCTEEDAVRVWPERNFPKILTHLIIRPPLCPLGLAWVASPTPRVQSFTLLQYIFAPGAFCWLHYPEIEFFASVQLYIVRAESVNTYFQTQKVYPQLQSLLLTEFSTNFQVLCYFLCLEFSDFSWPTNAWFLAWILPLWIQNAASFWRLTLLFFEYHQVVLRHTDEICTIQ